MAIVNDLIGGAMRPYASIARLVAGVALVGLIAGFFWSWKARGDEVQQLKAVQSSIVEAATVATVRPDGNGKRGLLKPEQVPAAIIALSRSLQSADSTLSAISQRTMTAKAAGEAADAALARDLAALRRHSAGAKLDEWDPWRGQ